MTHFSRLTAALVCLCLPLTVSGQNYDLSSDHYKDFTYLSSTNSSKESICQAAYTCYQDFIQILNAEGTPISQMNETRDRMLAIMPQLYNGAAIYQSQNPNLALQFAKAYVDIRSLKAFEGFTLPTDSGFPQLALFVANTSFKLHAQPQEVIKYARIYLSTGDAGNRKYAYSLIVQSFLSKKDMKAVQSTLTEAIEEFPDEYSFLGIMINTYVENEDLYDVDGLQKYVSMAMKFKPDDVTLLNIQGKVYEEKGDYLSAAGVFSRIRQLRPNILSVEEHLAINYYNLGVLYNNKCLMLSPSSEEYRKSSQTSEQYFAESLGYINRILGTQPNSVKYLEAKAVASKFSGNPADFSSANSQLAAMGAGRVSDNYVPSFISTDSKKAAETAKKQDVTYAQNKQDDYAMFEDGQGQPAYSKFMKQYVESRISSWQKKGEFETTEQYMERVSVKTREAKVAALKQEALDLYVKRYTNKLKIQDLSLAKYDADNQTYLIISEYGEMILPVPLANNEAMVFKNTWSGIQLSDAKYSIWNDNLRISSLTFTTPTGQKYNYDSNQGSDYGTTEVKFNFAQIDYGTTPGAKKPEDHKSNVKTLNIGTSDVDTNIPKSGMTNEMTFAFIIANENYTMVPEVKMALNDGNVFAEYCKQTLGIPESHVKMYRNATFGNMHSAMANIRQYAKTFGREANFIFYYSGHGIPDESDKGAYLLPIDADGTSTDVCYSLNTLYNELGATGANSVVAFIDACFSGASRDGSMLSPDARGVAISPRILEPSGNTVVFSAASAAQTAYPYKEKSHGMFTYFLLKKLQESSGDVTLKELSDYVLKNVSRSSLSINGKSQTPVVTPSPSIREWETMKLIH